MKNLKLIHLLQGLLVATALTVIACKGKNDNNQNQNAFIQNCTNCQNISGTPFFSAESTDYYRVLRMTWTFSGQNVTTNQPQNFSGQQYGQQYGQQQYGYPYGGNSYYYGNPYYNSPVMSYSGQVSAIGQVVINQHMYLGFCQIPAGTYNYTTQTAGQWSGGQISNLRITASGQVGFVAVLANAQAYSYNSNQPYTQSGGKIYGNLVLESVNGTSCNNSQVYLN